MHKQLFRNYSYLYSPSIFVLGGAERLVVDAAVGLQEAGHQVTIYTNHHDPSHCFEETRDGGFLSDTIHFRYL
jgi:hypothetical protein